MSDNYERMVSGRIYDCNDEKILTEQMSYLNKMYEYNQTGMLDLQKLEKLLPKIFAEVGEGCFITPPFYANWGGKHVHLGDNVYANYNLTLVDDGHIYIGDCTLIGPNVTIATASHPISPPLRAKAYQYNDDVRIGRNVWIGAGTVILPGVVIGDNTVIGAGSVVTKDIPPDVVAVGNPCRVMRKITEEDLKFYRKTQKIDID